MRIKIIVLVLFTAIVLNLTPTFSEEVSMTSEDTETIQEEIRWLQAEAFDLEVILASRKPEKLSEVAAAIYVITQEGIRRSGATCIPEVLRMVPGLQVARLDANKWAITSRGFNDLYANKLLVLIDGRSVYTPLYAGVYWDVQNVLLEDVERIEVIRGPGGTLWGANAVNGIINIITKSSKDTQGGLLTEMVGTEERNVSGIRYGGKIGKDAFYRIYARYFNHDDFGRTNDGVDNNDKWDVQHGGGRIDWDLSDFDSLTLLGNYYDGDVNEMSGALERRNVDFSGENLLGRWKHVFSDNSDMQIQMYYDRTYRSTKVIREIRDTFDLDSQHRFRLDGRNEIVWGLGYRYTTDDIVGYRGLQFEPDSRGDHLFSAFVQDEITLINDRLSLILGTKVEHNDYTGLEFQPTVRSTWTPSQKHTVWAAFSRAVKTPSRFDSDSIFKIDIPKASMQIQILGSSDVDSEYVYAHELGYRFQPTEHISLDITGFYNIYKNLLTVEDGEMIMEFDPEFLMIFPMYHDNKMDAETYGIEVSTNWNVTNSWKLSAGYTYFQTQIDLDKTSTDTGSVDFLERKSPQNQAQLFSYLNLPRDIEFDTLLYYVDHLGSLDVPSYLRLDLRLGWRPKSFLDMSIGMKNMLDGKHVESVGGSAFKSTEVERSIYGKIEWRF